MTRINKKQADSNPRMLGIYEQYKRAKRLLRLAQRCKRPDAKFTNLVAAVYPARAIIELMLESAEKQELNSFKNDDAKESREKLKRNLFLKHLIIVF